MIEKHKKVLATLNAAEKELLDLQSAGAKVSSAIRSVRDAADVIELRIRNYESAQAKPTQKTAPVKTAATKK
jgi:hypothetical protein